MKEIIENTIDDLISNFLYYDRKEDKELPVGAIQKAIKDGVLTKKQIIKKFTDILNTSLDK